MGIEASGEYLAHLEEWLLFAHKCLGFVVVFLVAPGALLTTKGDRLHRRLGTVYVFGMLLLYATGSYFTLTIDPVIQKKVARTLLFNFFGILLVVMGYTALGVPRAAGRLQPRTRDWALLYTLLLTSVLMIPVGFYRWYMFVFAVAGVSLFVVDYRAFRGLGRREVWLDRHIRYMLSSFFYVVTILSILELPRGFRFKWAWPSLVGALLVVLVTNRDVRNHFAIQKYQGYLQ